MTKVSELPAAAALDGTEAVLAVQGGKSVKALVSAISTYLMGLFQPRDADLDAIAALNGTNTIYYRSASNTWSPVTFGPNLGFSGGQLTVPGLANYAPLSGAAFTGNVTTTANVGIGTTTPGAKLDVAGPVKGLSGSQNQFLVSNGGGATTPNIALGYNSGKSVALGVGTNFAFFSFDSTGYFAIGPTSKSSIDSGNVTGNGGTFIVRGSGVVGILNAPTYASDSAAGSGGLVKGDVYQTSAGALMIKQ